jgi:hypothetical protein
MGCPISRVFCEKWEPQSLRQKHIVISTEASESERSGETLPFHESPQEQEPGASHVRPRKAATFLGCRARTKLQQRHVVNVARDLAHHTRRGRGSIANIQFLCSISSLRPGLALLHEKTILHGFKNRFLALWRLLWPSNGREWRRGYSPTLRDTGSGS